MEGRTIVIVIVSDNNINKFIKSKSKQDSRGWCKFNWEIEFKLNKDKVNPFDKKKELRDVAKLRFIDNVLVDSNRLRILSDLLAGFIPPEHYNNLDF